MKLTVICIIADDHLFDLSEFTHFAPEVLVKGVKVMLELGRCHFVLGIVGWVLVHVWEEDGLAVGWFDMFSAAAVAVSTSSYLVVETAVDFVLFGPEDGG